ncbi:MAG: hypothetical protein NWF00_06120 [Candidatus Bathyarchaeota archaeon]|nr:hypothetical protein [Candidatus Bathyarchaeota archaeon]
MGYRATFYISMQTIVVSLLGLALMISLNVNGVVSVPSQTLLIVSGLLLGAAFYIFITLQELQSLEKTGTAKIAARNWLALSVFAPFVFAGIHQFLTNSALAALALSLCVVFPFVAAGGLARFILLVRWEKANMKVVITNFYGDYYVFPKIQPNN